MPSETGGNSTLTPHLNSVRSYHPWHPTCRTQYLGMALHRNSTLSSLDISYNAIGPPAAMVIANAFRSNLALTYLKMDGNSIGMRGASTLMGALRSKGDKLQHVEISVEGCDTHASEDGALFNPLEPTMKAELDLSKPYDQMVANELLHLANRRQGCAFVNLRYIASSSSSRHKGKSKSKAVPIELVRQTEEVVNNQDSSHALGITGAAWHKILINVNNEGDRTLAPDQVAAVMESLKLKPTSAVVKNVVVAMNRHLKTLANDWVDEDRLLDLIFRSVFSQPFFVC